MGLGTFCRKLKPTAWGSQEETLAVRDWRAKDGPKNAPKTSLRLSQRRDRTGSTRRNDDGIQRKNRTETQLRFEFESWKYGERRSGYGHSTTATRSNEEFLFHVGSRDGVVRHLPQATKCVDWSVGLGRARANVEREGNS